VAIIGHVLEVLRQVDIGTVYYNYHDVIDLTLYLFFFVPLSLQTLGHHLKGRAGRMVALTSGVMLSLGLVLLEKAMGWTLRSLGVLAAAAVIFTATGTVLFTFHRLKGSATAIPVALLVFYFSLQAVQPTGFQWLYERAEWIALIPVLCVAALVVALVRSVGVSHVGTRSVPGSSRSDVKTLRAVTGELKDAKKIARELKLAMKQIKGGAPREEVKGVLSKARMQGEQLSKQVGTLWRLLKRVRSVDVGAYAAIRKRFKGEAVGPRKKHFKRELHAQLEKLQAEAVIEKYEKFLNDRVAKAGECLQRAAEYLDQGKEAETTALVEEAMKLMQDISRAAARMRGFEKKLEELTAYQEYEEGKADVPRDSAA